MLKKFVFLALLLSGPLLFAKKVKFAVDMSGQTISVNGVHISGDFQTAAGFAGGDWNSASTTMNREGNSTIYSVVVNLPALRKYEYKFVNGDQFYEVEFVPEKSRVGYDFNDNRWIYIDSLNSDTSYLPVLIFGKNAPTGKKMIRFKVDMQTQTSIDPNGVHLAGSFSNWNGASNSMYSFVNKVFECVIYADSLKNYTYNYLNGNSLNKSETLTGTCADMKNYRTITVMSDTVLDEVCFSSCLDCVNANYNPLKTNSKFELFPNPAQAYTILKLNKSQAPFKFFVCDLAGREIMHCTDFNDSYLQIDTKVLVSGIYFLTVTDGNQHSTTLKLNVKHE